MGFNNATLDAYDDNLLGGWAMNSPSGVTIELDRSGNNRNGTTYGNMTKSQTGIDGDAILFNGNGLINCGDVGSTLTGELSYGFWFKTSDLTGTLWVSGFNGYNTGLGIAIDTTVGSNRIYVYGGEDIFFDPESRAFSNVVTLNDGNWHLVIVNRKSDDTFGIYLDGTALTLQFNSAYNVDISSSTLRLCTGANTDIPFSPNLLIATLDESWIWDTELSAAANTALYNSGTGTFLIEYKNSEINSSYYNNVFINNELTSDKYVAKYETSSLNSDYKQITLIGSQLGSERRLYSLQTSSFVNSERRTFTWMNSQCDANMGIRRWMESQINPLKKLHQYVSSTLGDEPGTSASRSYYCVYGADIYVDDVWVGFIDFEDGESTLPDVSLTNGPHVIEVKLSKWFWPQTITTKRYYFTISGGNIVDDVNYIPDVVNLGYEVSQGGVVTYNWETNGGDSFSDSLFENFGIWVGPTSPVDISGIPAYNVPYDENVNTYSWVDVPTSSYYVRVAGYYDAIRGNDEEIYVEVDTIAPETPNNQFLDIAESEIEAVEVIGYSSSSSSSSISSSSYSSSSSSSNSSSYSSSSYSSSSNSSSNISSSSSNSSSSSSSSN